MNTIDRQKVNNVRNLFFNIRNLRKLFFFLYLQRPTQDSTSIQQAMDVCQAGFSPVVGKSARVQPIWLGNLIDDLRLTIYYFGAAGQDARVGSKKYRVSLVHPIVRGRQGYLFLDEVDE